MSILKYLSVILVGLAAIVCQAQIAVDVPPPEEPLEHPSASSGATPSEIELKVEPLRLAIDLVDGSRIIGVPSITSVPVETSYAKMDIPLEGIRRIKISKHHEGASFEFQNGDRLKGVFNQRSLELETVFGQITVDVQHITTVGVFTAPLNDYLVVDLSAGPSATSYPVTSLSSVPSGGWTDEYKTTKMVFRPIPAGTFIMGAPSGELGHQSNETQHEVTLTQDLYIGVFEVTQKQWERVMGTWPSYFNNTSSRDARPVEQVSYNAIRGSSAGAGWPASGSVDADSFMGRLRARTGRTFDLPTESQWEYAGRAGTTSALNSGYNLRSPDLDTRMAEVGRYHYNGGSESTQNGSTAGGTAKVGSYLPNAWGMYDIHGNVWEWCLDWYAAYPGTVSDPKGAISGSFRVFRGGRWRGVAYYCRAAYRSSLSPGYGSHFGGFRACFPPGQQ